MKADPIFYSIITEDSVLGIETRSHIVVWAAPSVHHLKGMAMGQVRKMARENGWLIQDVTDKKTE